MVAPPGPLATLVPSAPQPTLVPLQELTHKAFPISLSVLSLQPLSLPSVCSSTPFPGPSQTYQRGKQAEICLPAWPSVGNRKQAVKISQFQKT